MILWIKIILDEMEITYHVNSLFNSISYSIDSRILVDAGDEWIKFHKISHILLTHGHLDHIYGLNKVIEYNPKVKVYTNEIGREMLLNAKKNLSFYYDIPFVINDPSHIVCINDQEAIQLGEGLLAKAINTPGHHPSCISWIINDALFSGDAYIPGAKTVTNLPGGNKDLADQSLKLIMELGKNHTIYPGHKVN